jgi:hypothetical protein
MFIAGLAACALCPFDACRSFIWRSPPYADWTFGSGMLLRSGRLYRISKETALGSLEVRSK